MGRSRIESVETVHPMQLIDVHRAAPAHRGSISAPDARIQRQKGFRRRYVRLMHDDPLLAASNAWNRQAGSCGARTRVEMCI
jgi:hypothetical protein